MSDADYIYDVWRRGGNPDAVQPDDVPHDYDWVWDEPLPEHYPRRYDNE